ncbi:hypothetical protein AncyloWKF20_05585 [Ancylobacter sp. WKF20]|uniref:hypothetical protein n=1 Tax=Ancylobacter sp. WKF20 TaxID=3039801 RepID=UPI0024341B5A|nr:hypothetical protein [Ancylobacter sp. WKF20]WGD31297.1 hypothetical protein AncyloWKF20_05585 [Ancylobacter sp. WKF20]
MTEGPETQAAAELQQGVATAVIEDEQERADTPAIVTEGPETQAAAELQQDAATAVIEDEQERADMEAIGRSFMDALAVVHEHPDWKDWTPADDPAELVLDMLNEIDELKAKVPRVPPAGARPAALDWHEVAPTSVEGVFALIAPVLEAAEQAYIGECEPQNFVSGLGPLTKLSIVEASRLIGYALDRRPAPEVLFNKARELGIVTGTFDHLLPVDRASFELAARLIPAIGEVVATINAVIVEKNPPPAPAVTTRPVDIEDTIFEQTDGIGELDEQRAAAQAKADEAAAAHAAKKKPAKKKRSIADAAD